MINSSVTSNHFKGDVTSYNNTSGSIQLYNISNIVGTFSSAAIYNFNLDGINGPTGSTGFSGATGPTGSVLVYNFDGGSPNTDYTYGPGFNCGGVDTGTLFIQLQLRMGLQAIGHQPIQY